MIIIFGNSFIYNYINYPLHKWIIMYNIPTFHQLERFYFLDFFFLIYLKKDGYVERNLKKVISYSNWMVL